MHDVEGYKEGIAELQKQNEIMKNALDLIGSYRSWSGPNPEPAYEMARQALKECDVIE